MPFYILGSKGPITKFLPISVEAAQLSGKIMEGIAETGIRPNDGRKMLQPMTVDMLYLVIWYLEHHKPGQTVDPDVDRARLTLDTREKRMNLVTIASNLQVKSLRRLSIRIFCEHEETEENQTIIKVQSMDGGIFNLSVEGAKQSKVFADILKKLKGKTPVHPIPIEFRKEELDVAVKWMEQYKGKPIPEIKGNGFPFRVLVPKFDKKLLKDVENLTLMRTTSIGFHLEINGLVRSSTKVWNDRAPFVSLQEKNFIFTNL